MLMPKLNSAANRGLASLSAVIVASSMIGFAPPASATKGCNLAGYTDASPFPAIGPRPRGVGIKQINLSHYRAEPANFTIILVGSSSGVEQKRFTLTNVGSTATFIPSDPEIRNGKAKKFAIYIKGNFESNGGPNAFICYEQVPDGLHVVDHIDMFFYAGVSEPYNAEISIILSNHP